VTDPADFRRFERLVLPHLDAAYNLARWLARDEHDAHDVVQEAMLRALRYFGSLRGDNARPWLLAIVRHTCFGWLRENRPALLRSLDAFDEDGTPLPEPAAPEADEPLAVLARRDEGAQLNRLLAALPVHYREALVLRELEDLPYRDIATITRVPVGTVMSRLARARGLLRAALAAEDHATPQPLPRAANEDARP
jgi:RNA polymerase sigma-70 factor (ECF subfamily)